MGRRVKCLIFVAVVLGASGVSWGQKKASAPSPADGATDVIMALFQWKAGSTALFHNVYLGVTPNLGPEQLIAQNLYVTVTVYYHMAGVVPGTTYYWRVDEIDRDGVTVYTGDVWSFTAWPFTAFLPDPKDGSNTAAVAPILKWLKGRGALKHHVYLGDSKAAVADGAAEADKGLVTEPNYAPGELQPATTYFWRVDEIGVDGTPVVGNVWSFTTVLPIDDLESYTNEVGSRVFQTWIDGWGYTEPAPGNPGNGSGAAVGYDPLAGDIMETAIVHGGSQSMPFDYNNINPPYYSETERSWTAAQDWTANEVNMLTVHVRGRDIDFEIPAVTKAPVLDAQVEEAWLQTSVQYINTAANGTAPAGPADASGSFRVLYDATNLYVLVDVNDATLVQDSDPTQGWLDDRVEVFIDGDNSKNATQDGTNDYQYCFRWNHGVVEAPVEWYRSPGSLTGVEYGVATTASGYRVEIKLPWLTMIGGAAPVGKLLGIDVIFDDDDDGGDVDTQMAWHLPSGDPHRPVMWGTALLAKPATGGADRLYVALRDASNHTAVVTYPQADILKARQWVEWKIPLGDFAGVNVAAVRKMFIGVGDRANPVAGDAGRLYIDDIYLTRPAPKE